MRYFWPKSCMTAQPCRRVDESALKRLVGCRHISPKDVGNCPRMQFLGHISGQPSCQLQQGIMRRVTLIKTSLFLLFNLKILTDIKSVL